MKLGITNYNIVINWCYIIFQVTDDKDNSWWLKYFQQCGKGFWSLGEIQFKMDTREVVRQLISPDIVYKGRKIMYKFPDV